jgi:hypothetical protein
MSKEENSSRNMIVKPDTEDISYDNGSSKTYPEAKGESAVNVQPEQNH